MDKKRRNLTRLYLDKATLVWNGNAVSGQDALGEFFESLPSSEFQVHTLDCQPVHEQATQGQTTLLVVTGGTVKFEGNKPRFFNQNFLLTAQASPNNDQPVWKLLVTVSDFKTGTTEALPRYADVEKLTSCWLICMFL
ncbi:hypothetical protein INR49_024755 [Caranx melampygus]|nr:hypothetical protein INR49_024755 [Caranx melampygus]